MQTKLIKHFTSRMLFSFEALCCDFDVVANISSKNRAIFRKFYLKLHKCINQQKLKR